jgi:Yip1-like protein
MMSRPGRFTIDRFRTMLDRMVKSAKFNTNTFQSLKEDSTATGQALIVLALAGTSFGVGFTMSIGYDVQLVLLGALLGAITGIFVGFVWLSLTFLIGTKLFRGTSDYWSLARPVFFASSPGLVFLIMSIPVVPVPDIARAIGVAWIAISTVLAVKTALGLDNQRSILIFIIVAFIVLIGYGLVASLL